MSQVYKTDFNHLQSMQKLQNQLYLDQSYDQEQNINKIQNDSIIDIDQNTQENYEEYQQDGIDYNKQIQYNPSNSTVQLMMKEIYNLRTNLSNNEANSNYVENNQADALTDSTNTQVQYQFMLKNQKKNIKEADYFLNKSCNQLTEVQNEFSNFQDDQSATQSKWERLYNDAARLKTIKKKQMEQYDQARQKAEIQNLTFQPKIKQNRFNKQITNEKNIEYRNLEWKQRQQFKVEEQRMKEKDKDLIGCTFKPEISTPQLSKISKSGNSPQIGSNKGIDTFLRRQIVAREKKQNKLFATEQKQQKQSHAFTIPKEFSLSTNNLEKKIDCLKKPYQVITNKKKTNDQNSSKLQQQFVNNFETVDNTVIGQLSYQEALKHLHQELLKSDI